MSTTLEQLQYGFDRDSRRVWRQRVTTQGWDNAYVYDSLSQVIGDDRGDLNLAQNAIAGIPSNGARWQYDETGNWHGYETLAEGATALSQSRTHDKGNRLMEVSEAAAMRTDRAGRMLETVPGPAGDWSKGYQITWDAWSRIVGVAGVDGETVTPLATYGYDGLTRRITRYIDNEDATLHSYYNDEWHPVEERKDSETTASASYLWGSRHRDDLVRRDRAVVGTTLNETRYILMDYFSPASITDEEGDVTERYQFSAFGLRTILNPDFTVRSDSECAMEFGFQGQFEDIETGWLNYGYRYYLPALGRWSCKDPIEESGGFNLYAFVTNDGVNAVDYLGTDKIPRDQLPGQKPRPGQSPGNPANYDDFGTEVGDDDFPPEEDTGGQNDCKGCKCVQKVAANSPSGKSNLGRPSGPAGTGGECTIGAKQTLKYEGQCEKTDEKSDTDCSSRSCDFYVRWECTYADKRQTKTHWSQVPGGSAYTKCK